MTTEIVSAGTNDWKAVAEAVASVVTALGVVVAGVWAYWLYVRQRTRWPRAELAMELTHRVLPEDLNLLNAKVKIHNSGRGLMQPSALRIDLYRVLPLSDESRRLLAERRSLLDGKGFEAEWPCLESRERLWEEDAFDIEPGESDECLFDFFLAGDIETVFIYAYVDNQKKRKRFKARELGWSLTAFHDLVHRSSTASVVAQG